LVLLVLFLWLGVYNQLNESDSNVPNLGLFVAAWLVAGAAVGRWWFLSACLIFPLITLVGGIERSDIGDQPLWDYHLVAALIIALPALACGVALRRGFGRLLAGSEQ
jgi:hypothetical protein